MEVELYCCYSLPLRNFLYKNGMKILSNVLNINDIERTA